VPHLFTETKGNPDDKAGPSTVDAFDSRDPVGMALDGLLRFHLISLKLNEKAKSVWCEVRVKGKDTPSRTRTHAIKDTDEPVFDSNFSIEFDTRDNGSRLIVEAFDDRLITKHSIGKWKVKISDLKLDAPAPKSFSGAHKDEQKVAVDSSWARAEIIRNDLKDKHGKVVGTLEAKFRREKKLSGTLTTTIKSVELYEPTKLARCVMKLYGEPRLTNEVFPVRQDKNVSTTFTWDSGDSPTASWVVTPDNNIFDLFIEVWGSDKSKPIGEARIPLCDTQGGYTGCLNIIHESHTIVGKVLVSASFSSSSVEPAVKPPPLESVIFPKPATVNP
jgi:hypothetical protein